MRTLTKSALTPGETPSFFRVDSIRPPAVDDILISVAEFDAEAQSKAADRADLDSLLDTKGRAHAIAEDWLLRLDGGLFANIAPPSPAPLLDVEAPSPPAAPWEAPLRTPSLVEPVPVVSERPLSGRRRGDVAGWIAGGAAATTLVALIGWTLARAPAGREHATAAVAPPSPPAMAEPAPVAAAPTQADPVPAPSLPARMVSEGERRAQSTASRSQDGAHAAAALPPPSPKTVTAPRSPPRPPAATPAPPQASAGGEFDRAAARASLVAAAAAAARCTPPEGPGGARVSVTFAPTGRVTVARLVGGPFQGTPTGSCIVRTFRTASVPPFTGAPVTVTKDVHLR